MITEIDTNILILQPVGPLVVCRPERARLDLVLDGWGNTSTRTTQVYLQANPTLKPEAPDTMTPPTPRPGTFSPPDRCIELPKATRSRKADRGGQPVQEEVLLPEQRTVVNPSQDSKDQILKDPITDRSAHNAHCCHCPCRRSPCGRWRRSRAMRRTVRPRRKTTTRNYPLASRETPYRSPG